MSFTQRQANRYLNSNLLPANHGLTTSQAVCEADLRLRLLRWENRAVKDMDTAFKSTWAGMIGAGALSAERANIDGKLSTVNGGLLWRDLVSDYISRTIDELKRAWSIEALNFSYKAYYLGYYGKAWGLTASRKPELPRVPVHFTLHTTIQQRIKTEWLIRYGNEWDKSFSQPFDEFSRKSRSALNTAVTQQETPAQGMKRVKLLMGLPKLDKLYFAAQSHIRTLIQLGASLGELQLYTEFGASQPVREAVAGMDAVMGILTQGDGKVCPRCVDASRRLWPVNSITQIIGAALTFPIPPIHFNCRCSVFLFVLPDQLLSDDMLPGLTWLEFLALEGLDTLFGILDGKEVMPEMI